MDYGHSPMEQLSSLGLHAFGSTGRFAHQKHAKIPITLSTIKKSIKMIFFTGFSSF